jgi:hypothetical protein
MKIFLFTAAFLVVVVQINALFQRYTAGVNLLNAKCPTGILGANENVHENFILSEDATFKELRTYVSAYVQQSIATLDKYFDSAANKVGAFHEPTDNLVFLDRQLRAKRFNDRSKEDLNGGLEASVGRWFEENETRIESLTELSAKKIAYIVPAVGSTVSCTTTQDTNCEAMKVMIHEIHHQMVKIFDKFIEHYKLKALTHVQLTKYQAYVAILNLLNIFTEGPWLNTQDVLNEYSVRRDVFLDALPAVSHFLDLAMEAPEETIEHAHQKGQAGFSIIATPDEPIEGDTPETQVPSIGFEFDFTPAADYEHDMDELLSQEGLFIDGVLVEFKDPAHADRNHATLANNHATNTRRAAKVTAQGNAKSTAKDAIKQKIAASAHKPVPHPAGPKGHESIKKPAPKRV